MLRRFLLAVLFGLVALSPLQAQEWVVKSAGQDIPLPVDQAFRMSLFTALDGKVLLRVEMPPGYYLYRDKLQLSSAGFRIKNVSFPLAKAKHDEFLGNVRIYTGVVTLVVTPDALTPSGDLKVKFQGCAEQLVCYPPTTRVFRLG
jgi:thiol:disulfide interchange protein DsbD